MNLCEPTIKDDMQKKISELINEGYQDIENNLEKKITDLIQTISDDYNIPINELKSKFLKKKSNKQILNYKKIDGIDCYYEDHDGGSIFDKNINKIGCVKGGEYVLF